MPVDVALKLFLTFICLRSWLFSAFCINQIISQVSNEKVSFLSICFLAGFYHTGIVAPDALFSPLEALENEKINDKRPTLLINFENNEDSVKEMDDEPSQMDSLVTPDRFETAVD